MTSSRCSYIDKFLRYNLLWFNRLYFPLVIACRTMILSARQPGCKGSLRVTLVGLSLTMAVKYHVAHGTWLVNVQDHRDGDEFKTHTCTKFHSYEELRFIKILSPPLPCSRGAVSTRGGQGKDDELKIAVWHEEEFLIKNGGVDDIDHVTLKYSNHNIN